MAPVIVGWATTVATCTGVPPLLVPAFVVTTALRTPRFCGIVVKVTVSCVVVALDTMPTAGLAAPENVTVLAAKVDEKFEPAMVMVEVVPVTGAILVVLGVMVGTAARKENWETPGIPPACSFEVRPVP